MTSPSPVQADQCGTRTDTVSPEPQATVSVPPHLTTPPREGVSQAKGVLSRPYGRRTSTYAAVNSPYYSLCRASLQSHTESSSILDARIAAYQKLSVTDCELLRLSYYLHCVDEVRRVAPHMPIAVLARHLHFIKEIPLVDMSTNARMRAVEGMDQMVSYFFEYAVEPMLLEITRLYRAAPAGSFPTESGRKAKKNTAGGEDTEGVVDEKKVETGNGTNDAEREKTESSVGSLAGATRSDPSFSTQGNEEGNGGGKAAEKEHSGVSNGNSDNTTSPHIIRKNRPENNGSHINKKRSSAAASASELPPLAPKLLTPKMPAQPQKAAAVNPFEERVEEEDEEEEEDGATAAGSCEAGVSLCASDSLNWDGITNSVDVLVNLVHLRKNGTNTTAAAAEDTLATLSGKEKEEKVLKLRFEIHSLLCRTLQSTVASATWHRLQHQIAFYYLNTNVEWDFLLRYGLILRLKAIDHYDNEDGGCTASAVMVNTTSGSRGEGKMMVKRPAWQLTPAQCDRLNEVVCDLIECRYHREEEGLDQRRAVAARRVVAAMEARQRDLKEQAAAEKARRKSLSECGKEGGGATRRSSRANTVVSGALTIEAIDLASMASPRTTPDKSTSGTFYEAIRKVIRDRMAKNSAAAAAAVLLSNTSSPSSSLGSPLGADDSVVLRRNRVGGMYDGDHQNADSTHSTSLLPLTLHSTQTVLGTHDAVLWTEERRTAEAAITDEPAVVVVAPRRLSVQTSSATVSSNGEVAGSGKNMKNKKKAQPQQQQQQLSTCTRTVLGDPALPAPDSPEELAAVADLKKDRAAFSAFSQSSVKIQRDILDCVHADCNVVMSSMLLECCRTVVEEHERGWNGEFPLLQDIIAEKKASGLAAKARERSTASRGSSARNEKKMKKTKHKKSNEKGDEGKSKKKVGGVDKNHKESAPGCTCVIM